MTQRHTPDALLLLNTRIAGMMHNESVLSLTGNLDSPERAPEVFEWLDRWCPTPSRRLAVVVPESIEAPLWLQHVLYQHQHKIAMQQLTITKNGGMWARNFLSALKRRPTWATTAKEPWRGMPAFVVGASSSLDRNGHLLREAQKRGPIITTNSAAGCCFHHGVTPDVVVCAEALALQDHIAPSAEAGSYVALDCMAAPQNWDAAGDRALGVQLHEPYLAAYMHQLGVMPLHYSTSASTAATALAILWGASPIVMVGQRNGCTGKVYGDGSPFAENVAELRDGLLCYSGAKDPYNTPAVMRESWGGGELTASDHTFDGPIEWMGKVAERYPVINATEEGCAIAYSFEQKLETVIAAKAPRERPPLTFEAPPDTAPVLSKIARQAQRVIDDGLALPPSDFHLLHMWTIPAMSSAPRGKRLAACAEATQRGAREILEALS